MPAIVITGASTGIGEACALHLHGLGHTVFAGVRRDEDGERLRRTAGDDRLRPLRLDVTDEEQVHTAAEEVAAAIGSTRLAGVVNNAGIAIGGPIEFLPLDYWRRQLEVNVIGQVAVTQAFLPLVRAGAGRLVFIGSNSGFVAMPLLGPYSTSKFGIEAIGETLRAELDEWKIPVAVVEPGAIRTPIWEKGRALAAELDDALPPEAHARYGAAIERLRRGIEMQDRNGADPVIVARAVEHALFAERPKPRYPVGTDAKVSSLLVRLLPDRLRARVLVKLSDRV